MNGSETTATELSARPALWRTRGLWLLAIATGAGFAVLGASLIQSSIRASEARDTAAGWQIHTYQVMLTAERLQSAMFDAQRGRRGYVLNRAHDRTLLIPYRAAVARVPGELARLKSLTMDSAAQQRRVAEIAALIATQLDRMAQDPDTTPSTVVTQGSGAAGEVNVAQIRAAIGDLVAEEQRLLGERDARVAAADDMVRSAAQTLSISGLLLLAVALVTGYLALGAVLRARRAASEAAEASRARTVLDAAVAARTTEIVASNAALQEQIARSDAAEDQVRQMQKLESIGQLTGGIAHDFNNMLAIVIGSLDLARRRLDDAEGKVGKYLDNAMDGAKRAAALTARLLAFSRQQALAPEPIDANVFVGNVSELLRRTLGEAVQIETVLAGGLWRAYSDASELENAIVNLAVNARDAMDGAGKLTIETANTHLDDTYAADHADVGPGQYVVICVTDTGGGMTKAVIDKAFDPFFTTKGVGKGTGLGLSQVFGFVKQSGGHVKIYSEEGKGTTVKLYMPRWTGGDAPARGMAAVEAIARARDGETVLVVEDEERVRLVTVDTLREFGYTVIHAGEAEAAMAAVQTDQRIDLLFTDIVMPGRNGRELAEAAKALRPELKVLYTTGYTRNAVVHNGMLDAQVAFLAKPFTVAALATKVRQVLDGGGINRAV